MTEILKNKFDKKAFKKALKNCSPVIYGYLPTGFTFGFMLSSLGYHYVVAVIMSVVVYAGAGQYLAVELFKSGAGYLELAIVTFLINSKHLFYGFSLLEDYNKAGKKKPYLIFSLTDETYALLTKEKEEHSTNRSAYCFYVSIINHSAWILSSFLGAVLGYIFEFNTKGMSFAMTALFIVIIMEQLKNYKTKIPFIVGTLSGIFSLIVIGKSNMLLSASIISCLSLVLLKDKIQKGENKNVG